MWQHKWMMVAYALALSACGGSDQETSANEGTGLQAPGPGAAAGLVLAAPTAVQQSSHLALEWTAPAELTNFSVRLAPNGSSEFAPIATGLPADARTAEVDRGVAWKLDFPTARIQVRGCDANGQCTDSNEQPLQAALMGSVVTVASRNEGYETFGRYDVESKARLSTDGNTLVVKRSRGWVVQFWAYHRTPDGRWHSEAALDLPLAGDTEMELSGDGSTAIYRADQQGTQVVVVLARNALNIWSQQALLSSDSPLENVAFARQFSISEDGRTIAANGNSRVLVFTRNDAGVWSRDSLITEPAASATPLQPEKGLALSPDGKFIAVSTYGGRSTSDSLPDLSGPFNIVRVYRRDCKCHVWGQQADLRSDRWPYEGMFPDAFGEGGIKFDGPGERLVIGAHFTGAPSRDLGFLWGLPGAVYVFDRTDTTWQKSARINNYDRPYVDDFGRELSLSRDGKVLAAGTCGFFAAAAENRNHPAGWDFSRLENRPEDVNWRCEPRIGAYIYTANDQEQWTFKTSVYPNNQNAPDTEDTKKVNVDLSGDGKTFIFNWSQYRVVVGQEEVRPGGCPCTETTGDRLPRDSLRSSRRMGQAGQIGHCLLALQS